MQLSNTKYNEFISVLKKEVPVKYLVFLVLLSISYLSYANSIDPQTAVSEHNKWRNLLNQGELGMQPRPNPFISEMYWDQSLADSSQVHADKCVWAHSGTGGENLYVHSASGSIEEGVRLWVAEQADFDYSPISLDNFSAVGHYTQVVWHNSLRVGCAKTQCNNIEGLTFSGTIYVCQYRENGNFLDQYPYSITGQPSTEVAYTGANTNLQFQLIKVGDDIFRALLKIKTFAPLIFETITYELVEQVDISQFSNMAEFKGDMLMIPELSIDGVNKYEAVLKHLGGLEFEVIDYSEH